MLHVGGGIGDEKGLYYVFYYDLDILQQHQQNKKENIHKWILSKSEPNNQMQFPEIPGLLMHSSAELFKFSVNFARFGALEVGNIHRSLALYTVIREIFSFQNKHTTTTDVLNDTYVALKLSSGVFMYDALLRMIFWIACIICFMKIRTISKIVKMSFFQQQQQQRNSFCNPSS